MSLITAQGIEAKESSAEKQVDFEKTYIRLKDGENVRVRLLGIKDTTVAEYRAHGDYEKKIYTSPCVAPTGAECPYCVASESGLADWKDFYPRKRYLLVFYDIDTTDLRVWDASKQQGESMLKMMAEYDDAKETMAFNFRRTGSGASDTQYHLMPILSLDDEGKELFENGKDVVVADDFFGSVLIARKREHMIENLKGAGFPTVDFFDDAVVGSKDKEATEDEGVESVADSDIAGM